MTKKTFANLHYPGMVVDPKEVEANTKAPQSEGLSKPNANEAWTQFLSHTALQKLQRHSTLIIGDNHNAVSWVKLLAPVPVKSIGFVSQALLSPQHQFEEGLLKNLTPTFGTPSFDESILCNTTLTQAMSMWLKSNYPSARFETFSRLHFDQALEDIKKGFDSIISITDTSISITINDTVRLKADTTIRDSAVADQEIKQLARLATSLIGLFYEWLHMVCNGQTDSHK